MRSLRSVTLAPMTMFSRSLKPAMEFPRPGGLGFLAGDERQVLHGGGGLLGVVDRLADAHVQHDLVEPRDLHLVGVAELLTQGVAHLGLVDRLQAGLVAAVGPEGLVGAGPTSRGALGALPEELFVGDLATDDLPGRLGEPDLLLALGAGSRRGVGLPLESTMATLETCSDASLRLIPPWGSGLRGLGVALDHVQALHHQARILRHDLQDLALLAPCPCPRAGRWCVARLDLGCHHSTSGASEMIFIWFFARKFARHRPEDARTDRLGRLVHDHRGVLVEADGGAVLAGDVLGGANDDRARSTSPFFTRPRGMASLTDTTMTSPTLA